MSFGLLPGKSPEVRRSRLTSGHHEAETLEVRILPVSHTFSAGVVTIYGTDGAEDLTVSRSGYTNRWSNGGLGGEESYGFYYPSTVTKIVVYGRGGHDKIAIDEDTWIPVDVYGEAGNDTLIVSAGYHKAHGGIGNDTINVLVNFDTVIAGRRTTFDLATDYKSGNGVDTVNVKLDASSLARRYINPLVQNIRSATYAVEPVLDLLNAKVPVIGSLDSSLTFSKFLKYSSSAGASISKFVDTVSAIRDLSSVSWTSGSWNLGTFKITSGKSLSSAVTTVTSRGIGTFDSSEFMTKLRNIGITFPGFSNPVTFVQTLMGGTANLVEFKVPTLTASASRSNSWYVPTGVAGVSVKVSIKGSISASAGMTVGLDTSGFWTGRLMDGFYVRSAVASVTTRITGSGSVAAGIPGVWDAVEAGAKATISGTLSFRLKDPNGDGKTRIGELTSNSFFNSVNRTGTVNYSLAGYVGYEVLEFTPFPEWVSYEKDWVFSRGTLYASSF